MATWHPQERSDIDRMIAKSANPRLTLLVAAVAVVFALVLSDSAPVVKLGLPIAIILGVATIRWPLVGLSLLVIVILTNASNNLIQSFGLPSIAKLAAPGLTALLGLRYFVYGDRPYIARSAILWLTALYAFMVLGATYAVDWSASLDVSVDFLKNAILAVIALAFLNYYKSFETIVYSAVLTLGFLCFLGVFQLVLGLESEQFKGFSYFTDRSDRFAGPIQDPNFFAAMVVFAIPVAVHKITNARSTLAASAWSVLVLLLLFGLFATESRGAIVAIGFGMLVLMATMTTRQMAITALLGIAVIVAVGATASDDLLDRIRTIGEVATEGSDVDKSTEGRLASWRVAYELAKQHPVLGVGPGNFNTYYQDTALQHGLIFRGEGRSAHSLYLEFLAEQGVVGLGLFLIILALGARNIIRGVAHARRTGDSELAGLLGAFGAGLAAYLMAMAFLHDSFPRFLWLVIALAVEAAAIGRRAERSTYARIEPVRSEPSRT